MLSAATCLALVLAATAPGSGTVTTSAAELAVLSGGSPPTPGAPWTLAAGITATVTLRAPAPMRDAGLWWSGAFAHAEARRLAPDGTPEPWRAVAEDHDQSPEAAGVDRPAGARRVSGLIVAYGSPGRDLELRITGPASLHDVVLVWIAPPVPGALPFGGAPPQTAAAGYPKPQVYSRAQWGAAPAACTPTYCATTHVGVHHSASSSHLSATTFGQCAANVKGIQTYHMVTNGWCDIGYNYLVCHHGDLFEGRAGGDDVKGAHDGFNCGSMGVCAMGYFHAPYNQTPPAAMRQAIEELGAWKCSQQSIDPLGSSLYSGYGAAMSNVYGHRDVKSTACPGDALYALLPAIRANIQALVNGPGAAGTLKGVLYDAAFGTAFRIAGGTVALSTGASTVTGSDGYYEFPLPAGTYGIAATAAGYQAKASQETVTGGDVWESLGLSATTAVPKQTATSLGGGLFQCTWQGDPGTGVLLVYAAKPGIPLASTAYGLLWPQFATATVLALGSVPSTGVKVVNLQAPTVPGLTFQIQGFVVKGGQARLTNGAALIVP